MNQLKEKYRLSLDVPANIVTSRYQWDALTNWVTNVLSHNFKFNFIFRHYKKTKLASSQVAKANLGGPNLQLIEG